MTSPKLVKKRRQQLHACDVRSLDAFCFFSSGRKNSQQNVFSVYFSGANSPILRPDKHAELLKNYFKPLVKKLNFSILVTKSDLRLKVH